MDTEHQNDQEQEQPSDEQILQELIDGSDGVAMRVPVVRTNTPRPLSFARSSAKSEQVSAAGTYPTPADFPIEAPAAPPLPEELENGESGAPVVIATTSIPLAVAPEPASAISSEFTWLFEYGLEMDGEYLNNSARLNGQAHIYGPAVLKGYRIEGIKLQNGRAAITLARGLSPEQEVWGILYRIPQRLAEPSGLAPSALDNAHAAYPFTAAPVVAQEMYRKRAVQCITYMLSETARKKRGAFSPVEGYFEHSYAQRLLDAARRQKLPDAYLHELAALVKYDREGPSTTSSIVAEQNTEPLPIIAASTLLDNAENTASTPTPGGWLLALAIYLVGLLMAALALAVMQTLGYWSQVFNTSFAPLGAPWYMLLYGLLGGCISCIMTLGRPTRPGLPGFVILTWFTRPYLGAVLAALAYLMLSSGLFVISAVPEQRYAIFSVVGAIAGLCEGWVFFRQR